MTTVLVTGANSDLGEATTTALLARGAAVVATVRSDEDHERLTHEHRDHDVVVERLDVTDAECAEEVVARHRPDVLVNSAGTALLGAMADISDDDARGQFESLVIGPCRLARLVVEHRPQPDGGRIVNISSTLAVAPLPFTGWYSAAKAALDAATEALRLELRPLGIAVVRVECGPIRTGAWDHAADDVTAGDDPATLGARARWARLTTWAHPAFVDPALAGRVVASAALDRRARAVHRLGPGSQVARFASLLPAPIHDAALAKVFDLDR